MQIVPIFSKIPLIIHQNSVSSEKFNFFSGGGAVLIHQNSVSSEKFNFFLGRSRIQALAQIPPQ